MPELHRDTVTEAVEELDRVPDTELLGVLLPLTVTLTDWVLEAVTLLEPLALRDTVEEAD